MDEPKHPEIMKAILDAGSQAELARRCGCAQQTISKLLTMEISVTPQIAIAISRATGGKILIADLLPDVFKAVRDEIERGPMSEEHAA